MKSINYCLKVIAMAETLMRKEEVGKTIVALKMRTVQCCWDDCLRRRATFVVRL